MIRFNVCTLIYKTLIFRNQNLLNLTSDFLMIFFADDSINVTTLLRRGGPPLQAEYNFTSEKLGYNVTAAISLSTLYRPI